MKDWKMARKLPGIETSIKSIIESSEGMDVQGEMNFQSSYINEDNQIVDNLMGLVVDGEEEAYNLYNNYAIQTGFSVRKSKRRLDKNQNIRQREFCCSKAGYKVDDKHPSTMQRRVLETRNGCEAMIRFSINDGKWTVAHFVPNHNHELASPSEVHMLRSNRKLTSSKTNVIDSMVDAGVSVINTYSYMAKEVGGDKHLGFTKKDCYNYITQKKNLLIEAGDSQSLINHFKKLQAEDGMFFYTIQVDDENRMTNFFWRDGRSRIDYNSFGDVIVFDTTYRTNKYDLICAPFVGVNHHRQNVMFGCAFLSNETTTSFIWLFESFLESMGGKAPQTIVTDQDQAMANAIAIVFPNSRHRLCIWHISQNAQSHLGALKSNSNFRNLFYKMLQRCESEDEFDQTWNKICESFEEVKTHKWLNKLYRIRQKWCKGLNKDAFSAGILSSQRSEATNTVLNNFANKTTTLTSFVHQFEAMVAGWRSSEAQEDFRCKQGKFSCVVKSSGLLNHAAKIYTCEIYKQFEKQFLDAMGTISTEVTCSDNIHTYELQDEMDSRTWIVHFNASTMKVNCTCKKFESKGYVCCHILRALSFNNVTKIPESCILHRWTKDARKRLCEQGQGDIASMTMVESDSMFRNEMMRCAYDIVMKSQGDKICRKLCRDGLRNLNIEIESWLSTLDPEVPDTGEDKIAHFNEKKKITDVDSDVEPILNPQRVKPKGVSNARLKGHFETRKVKAKNAAKCGNVKRQKKGVNLTLDCGNPAFAQVDPRRNCESITPPQMISHSFPNSHYPLLMSNNMQIQNTTPFPLPLLISNQVPNENDNGLSISFTSML